MKTSDSIAKLSLDFVKAQAELKNAVFDKVNPHFKSKYATLSAVRDTVVPVLAKHNLAVLQGTVAVGEGWAITTRLIHASGEWIESQYPFNLDKPQGMGSAMTYARRYCLAAICGIASEEDDDANEAQKSDVAPLPSVHSATKSSTRSEKDLLCGEIDNFTSLSRLEAWGNNPDNIKRIRSLNPELADVVRQSYSEKIHELKERAAA